MTLGVYETVRGLLILNSIGLVSWLLKGELVKVSPVFWSTTEVSIESVRYVLILIVGEILDAAAN